MGAGLGESQQQRGQAGAGHFVILHNIHYAKWKAPETRQQLPWHIPGLAGRPDPRNGPMPRRRTRLNWLYDNDLQQFTTPSGQVVTLLQIAQLLQDQVNCSHDFAGTWTGWRIRQNRLIAPGQTFKTSQITPTSLRAFSRWLSSFEGSQCQLPLGTYPTGQVHPGHIDTASLSRTEPQAVPSNEHAAAEQRDSYAPRSREKVVQMADYRRRAIVR